MADWHAIALDGPDTTLRAFVAGFLAGRGEPREAVVHGPDIPLEPGSLGERLRALLHSGQHEVLLVDASLGAALASALARHADEFGIRVSEHVAVAAAWFEFSAETPSREAAARIDAELADPPAGVTLIDQGREELDPNVHGIGLRDPAHAYTFRTKGRATGTLDGVLALHRRLKGTDFVTVQALHLVETPIGSGG
jgi:hypothetical protein